MNHDKNLRADLITVVNENGLDKLLGVSDRVVGDYLMASLDALSTIVAVARNQATIDLMIKLQNDAINQAVNGPFSGQGLGRISPGPDFGAGISGATNQEDK